MENMSFKALVNGVKGVVPSERAVTYYHSNSKPLTKRERQKRKRAEQLLPPVVERLTTVLTASLHFRYSPTPRARTPPSGAACPVASDLSK